MFIKYEIEKKCMFSKIDNGQLNRLFRIEIFNIKIIFIQAYGDESVVK